MEPQPKVEAGASGRRTASLRSHLTRIVVVAFVPLLLFSATILFLLATAERRTFLTGARQRTLALVTAVDTELKRSIDALEVLATSENLRQDGLGAFRVEAQRVLLLHPEWLTIGVARASGEQVLNLLHDEGQELEPVFERRSLESAVRDGRPAIGDLFRDVVTGAHVFAVRVPVGGGSGLVLYALVEPEGVNALLSPQGLPEDWVGVVLDREQTIVARTISPETTVGKPAAPSLRTALDGGSSGWFEGKTLEGWRVYTPYDRSSFSGWSVAIGVPAAAVEAPFRRSLLLLAGFGAAALFASLLLASLLSQRSSRSIEDLASLAEDLAAEREPPAPRSAQRATGITEVDDLRAALANAERLIRDRSQERDRVVDSLSAAEARLRESDRRKDEFLAMLGHELRNPLGILGNAVQIFKLHGSEQAAVELYGMMERQVADMTRLLDDLLDVSRITQGRIRISLEPCDLAEVVRQVTDDHRVGFEGGGVTLAVHLPEAPVWIMGDRTRLVQVLVNLLSNARKFTPSGGNVTVALTEDPDGAEIVLTVRDDGVGMDAEILEQAFTPFAQADRTIDRSRGGLGLGLALVRGLVELHDGRVEAASEGAGKGSCFTLRLPRQIVALPHRDATLRAPAVSRPRRVLVVEDNRMAARSLEMFLVEHGHTVHVAHSGTDGIEAARSFEPDVVLCDIGLPGADGYEVARALRGDDDLDGVTMIAVTGYGQGGDRRKARDAGFDRHLTKPVDLDELREILAGLG